MKTIIVYLIIVGIAYLGVIQLGEYLKNTLFTNNFDYETIK